MKFQERIGALRICFKLELRDLNRSKERVLRIFKIKQHVSSFNTSSIGGKSQTKV